MLASSLLVCSVACRPPGLTLEREAEESDGGGDETAESSSDTTASDTTAETAPSETEDGLFAFIDDDVAGMILECDPILQDCPEGDKCVPYASTGGVLDENKCVPVLGSQATGEPCVIDNRLDANDNCDATGVCSDLQVVDGKVVGTCHAFCTGSWTEPQCPVYSYCQQPSNSAPTMCIPMCNPLTQDCAGDLSCYHGSNGIFLCGNTQGKEISKPCGFINDCAAGLICLGAESLPDCGGEACCTVYCDLQAGDVQCAGFPGTVCLSFWDDTPLLGYENLGVCVSP